MKEKRNQMNSGQEGATDWIWASIPRKGSLTVAWDTQLLGLRTQRDVTLLTSVLKFPGVLLCGLTPSPDSHKNWACMRPRNSPLIDFSPFLYGNHFSCFCLTQFPLSQASVRKGDTSETGQQEIPSLSLRSGSPSAPLTLWP